MKLVVFRADASPAIGGGHVMRCLTLATQLHSEGWDCVFACRSDTPATVPHLVSSSFSIVPIGGEPDDEPDQLRTALPDGCDLLIVDHYGWAAAPEQACRGWARQILVIDDLANRPHDCDLLLDQTFGRDAADYATLVPDDCRILVGSAYALLRPDFSAVRSASLQRRRQAGGRLQRIVISMGLTDAVNATASCLRGVAASNLALDIDIILGYAAPHRDAIAATLPDGAHLHVEPIDIAALLAQADLAIGASGTSALERACLGLPTLALVTADNQEKVAKNFAAAGGAEFLGRPDDDMAGRLATHLRQLSGAPERLLSMATVAATLCDGRGAQRAVLRLAPEHSQSGGIVELRPADTTDMLQVHAWQSEAGARRYARNPQVPSLAEHGAWFAAQLRRPASLFNIVLCDGKPAGILRLDPTAQPGQFEVSILICQDCQGQRIGQATLRLARRLVPEAALVAEILPENQASILLFTRAGFTSFAKGWYIAPALSPVRAS